MATNSHLEDCRHCDGGRKVGPTLRSSTSGENNTISLCFLNCENGNNNAISRLAPNWRMLVRSV